MECRFKNSISVCETKAVGSKSLLLNVKSFLYSIDIKSYLIKTYLDDFILVNKLSQLCLSILIEFEYHQSSLNIVITGYNSVSGNLMTTDHKLYVAQNPEVRKDENGKWVVEISCGRFIFDSTPRHTVNWTVSNFPFYLFQFLFVDNTHQLEYAYVEYFLVKYC